MEGKKFLLIFCMILLIGSVSAFDWDNVKNYDEETKTITIKNSILGIPFLELDTVATIKLKSEGVKLMNSPQDNFFEIEVNNIKMDTIIDEVKYYSYNQRTKEIGKEIQRENYWVRYDPNIDREVETFKKVCKIGKILFNGTILNDCYFEQTKTIEKGDWVTYNPNEEIEGVILLRNYLDIEENEWIEYIPTFVGVEVTEWASVGNDGYTMLLLNMDGVNQSKTFIDISIGGSTHSLEAQGTSQVRTDIKKFGSGSAYFNGTTPYPHLTTADSSDWDFGSDNWTIDFWMYELDSATGGAFTIGEDDQTMTVYLAGTDMHLYASSDGATWDIHSGTLGATINPNTWYHIAFARNDTAITFFVDGVITHSATIGATALWSPVGNFTIGRDTSSSAQILNGYIDEFRISNIARWNADFTPPSEPYGVGDLAPIVTVTHPANNTNWTTNSITTSGIATDDFNLLNVSLYLGGSINQSNTTIINNSVTNFSLTLDDGTYDWYYDAWDNASKQGVSNGMRFTIYTSPEINVTSPLNQSYTSPNIYFNATNSLAIDQWTINYNGTNHTKTLINISLNVEDGFHHLLLYGRNAITGKHGLNDSVYFSVDTIPPIVNAAQNLTDWITTTLPLNITWNYTVNDPNIDTCYYNTSEQTDYKIITCNASITNTEWTTEGNKTIQFCANDTFGWETCNVEWQSIALITYAQEEDQDPVPEGSTVTFHLQLNQTAIGTTTANLFLNGSTYTPTTTNAYTDYYDFYYVFSVPDGFGNTTGYFHDWYWNYTISGIVSDIDTATTTLTVFSMDIDDCSTYGEVILNLTLYDEELNAVINGTLGSNIEIDLELQSLTNSSLVWDYSNTWVNDSSVTICIPPNVINNTNYQIDFTVGYDSTDRVWEFYYLDNGNLNLTKQFNSYTNYIIELRDLASIDSTSFLFNYYDEDGLAVDGSIVHLFRKYIGEGEFREVERAKADQNGDTTLHLVEEDVIYYFMITLDGTILYTSSTYTALCQATPCAIQLEASGEFVDFPTDYDLIDTGAIAITSDATDRIVNLSYAMTTASIMNFTLYRYESDGTYSVVDTDQETGTSGVIQLNAPLVAGNVSFFASVGVDNQFIKSQWIDFESDAADFFGETLALLLAGLIILTLALIGVTEGAGTIVMLILGVIFAAALGLLPIGLSSGINMLIYLICAGSLIIWKLATRRKG